MRLHAYSTRQRFLVHGNPGAIMNVDLSFKRRQLTVRWKKLDALQRTYLAIVLAFIIQAIWTFFAGPFVLFVTRNIHDTHYWALQTRLAIAMSLIGTPMWLIFVYSDSTAVANVNKYLAPGFWFIPGLMTFQFTSIILPLWDAHTEGLLYKRFSLDNQSTGSIIEDQTEKQRSMGALEEALEKNVEPLLLWAARREFTAENIVFLKAVRDFKRKWRAVANTGVNNDDIRLELFEDAAYIYFACVDHNTAAFNINVESKIYDRLKSIFGGVRVSDRALDSPTSEHSDVCPFDDLKPFATDMSNKLAAVDTYALPTTEIESTMAGGRIQIPQDFNVHVFDEAFRSIKYLVFTNTWQRYLNHSETSSMTSAHADAESGYVTYQPNK
ncbi:MAG: hypothetical protein Q9157_007490 [Trypethelium eluteriae]